MATTANKSQKPAVKLAAFRAVVENKIKKLTLTKLEEKRDRLIERRRELQEAIEAQDSLMDKIDMAIFDKRERRYADIAITAEKMFNDGDKSDPDLASFMKVFKRLEERWTFDHAAKKGKRGRPATANPPPPTGAGGSPAKSKKGPQS